LSSFCRDATRLSRLINTGLNRSARALSKASESLDRIASAVFRAKGDQSRRNQIYSDTLDALDREDEKISNLRESMVSVERLLLFLEIHPAVERCPSRDDGWGEFACLLEPAVQTDDKAADKIVCSTSSSNPMMEDAMGGGEDIAFHRR
jgi:hypothetical protein